MNIKDFEALYGNIELAIETDLGTEILSLDKTAAGGSVTNFNNTENSSSLKYTDPSLEGIAKLIQNKKSTGLLAQTGLASGETRTLKLQSPLEAGVQKLKKLIQTSRTEIKIFIALFLGVISLFYFFTNAQLLMVILQDTFTTNQVQASPLLVHQAADREQEQYDAKLALQEKFSHIQAHTNTTELIAPSLENFLEQKEGNQSLDYNLLPPTNRLIIPDLNINVPLIDAEAGGKIDFGDETFDTELMKGVVKYPTTPTPGNKGNTLIFGHTSTERWKKNPYGVVFRNLPKLKPGQQFQVVWNGQITTYEMIERKVVLPKNVAEYYETFSGGDESYLTLMGCYPIGTADKRMMVVAKKVG